jgi:hypothetical protein
MVDLSFHVCALFQQLFVLQLSFMLAERVAYEWGFAEARYLLL